MRTMKGGGRLSSCFVNINRLSRRFLKGSEGIWTEGGVECRVCTMICLSVETL